MKANNSTRFGITGSLGIMLALSISACGNSQSSSDLKIVGGENVVESDSVVSSTVALVDQEGRQFCTGTLVTSKHVVTAAHCVRGHRGAMYVAFGTKAKLGSFTREKLRVATSFVGHSKFNELAMAYDLEDTPANDIALVTMDEAAPNGHNPAPVMRQHNEVRLEEKLILAGYGRQAWFRQEGGILAKVTTSVSKLRTKAKELDFASPGKSACMGDSGGPAFVVRGTQLALVGVTSRGSGTCAGEGTYTDIRYFVDWIISEL
jgi:secreted trypsin-like serine protease